MAQWLVDGWATNAIFNLKLPMKQRFTAMQNAQVEIEKQLKQAGLSFTWQAKHLYHNRDEVTVCIITTP
jgi:23S rRNA (cytidine2498-2'-O)-methyltransferase